MKKWAVVAFCAGVFVAGSVSAQTTKSNAGAARAMADVLSGTPGIGGIAPTVSGKNAPNGDTSKSGWGNTGSLATTGTSVARGNNK